MILHLFMEPATLDGLITMKQNKNVRDGTEVEQKCKEALYYSNRREFS